MSHMIDFLTLLIGSILVVLSVFSVYTVNEYVNRLRKAQGEYEKAKDSVEDIVISFNRELKREADKIENVAYKVEGTLSKADVSLRKTEIIEKRIEPIENEVNEISTQVANLNSTFEAIMSNNEKVIEKMTSLDLENKSLDFAMSNEKIAQVNSKVETVESSQEELKRKISELEEQIRKLTTEPEIGNASTDVISTMPVMPIRRDKALAFLTVTEVEVLEFLVSEGPKTAPEIKEEVKLSREHTARLMKKLYEEGYLERETGKLPFKYSVKKEMENLLRNQVNPHSS